jgi:hypothetical protein
MSANPRVIFVAFMIIVLIWGPQLAAAQSRATQAPVLGLRSAVNQVPDFSAEGVGDGYSLKITSEGGYLSSGGSSIQLTPWGHVKGEWGTGTVDIIFLVNVTRSNFYIAFLYLTNSSSQVVLRTFGYQGAILNTIEVQGSQRISNKIVETSPVSMPKVQLDVTAQTDNELSIAGPEVYMVGNYGTVLNDSTPLRIAALRNQLFSGAKEYNELWSLLADDLGDYYFAIIYMQNGDPNHVIVEHQIRLNDLHTPPGLTLNAQWTRGHFAHSITVRLPGISSTVKVNGFPFQTSNNGVLSVEVGKGLATVEVPNELVNGNDTRVRFSSWVGYGNANPLNVTLNPRVSLNAEYKTEYQLMIDSAYGNVTGAGWYSAGTNASYNVSALMDLGNGTRRVFLGFSGDENLNSTHGWLVMDSPKHVSVNWKTQQRVTLELSGLPSNSTVMVDVNGSMQSLSASKATELWVDSSAHLSVNVETAEIETSAADYIFKEVQVNGQASGSGIMITRPIVVSIVFSEQQKTQPTITLQVNPASPISGYPVEITGSLSTDSNSSNVSLFYSADRENWEQMANVLTRQDGSFSCTWTPKLSGSYFIRAYWQGDARYAPSSEVVPITVRSGLPSGMRSSGNLLQLNQDFADRLNRIPIVSVPLELARSLLLLGVVLTAVMIPSSPPILGYFAGSLFVGFAFVFPFSMAILAFNASRKRRSPSAVWLTPLLTIWGAALLLLLADGILFAAPQALLATSTILLISSNALLVPLAFSLLLARAITSH